MPEIEQAPGCLVERRPATAFTPHLVPMERGILATCYARPRTKLQAPALYDAARACYAGEPFVKIVRARDGRSPHTSWASGSNLVFLSYAVNQRTGCAIAISAIDNLGKGAAWQAVQDANLMTGQTETAGLEAPPPLT